MTMYSFSNISGIFFFFESYIIPLFILFAVGQLKYLYDMKIMNFLQKKGMIFWLVVCHAGMFIFLIRQDGMVATTLITVAGSLIVFVLAYLGRFNQGLVLFFGLAFLVIVQPQEVFSHYSKNAKQFQCKLPSDHVRPQFSWTRPTQEIKSDCKIFKFVHYESFYDSMAMKDSRGYIGYPVSVTRGVFLLSQWVDEQTLIGFASQKFWLYDRAFIFDEKPLEIKALADVLRGQYNAAYINAGNDAPAATFTPQDWGEDSPAAVLDPARATVEHFDVNHLKMTVDVPSKKFLVYTDGFTKFWKVLVNGREERLVRAQAAFKGVWIPSGKSAVEFRYDPPGGGWIYMLVTASLFVFMMLSLVGLYREQNWPWLKRLP